MTIQLDMLQTLAIAAIVLYVGKYVKRFIPVLTRLCIPDPVVGGILFSLLTLAGYSSGLFILEMDTKTLCSPDCMGLCPGCGVNLNHEECRCKKAVDPRLAKLAQLLENK